MEEFNRNRIKRNCKERIVWNNLRARHYSVLILLAIVVLETSAIAIDSFLIKENDVAFTIESSFQNNHYIQNFQVAEANCQKAPISIARPNNSVKKDSTVFEIPAPVVTPKIEKTVSAEFIAAANEKENINTYVEYSVQKGDSLSNIAKMFGSRTKEIKVANKLENSHHIKVGQTIKVPLANSEMVYTVKKGDSLSKIANKFKLPLQSLINFNSLKTHRLIANQKIKIPISTKGKGLTKVELASSPAVKAKKLNLVKTQKHQLIPSKKLSIVNLSKLQMVKAPAIKPEIKFSKKELLKTPPAIVSKPKASQPTKVAKIAPKQEKEPEVKVSPKQEQKIASSKFETYRVKKGDSLSKIANKFNTTIAQIKTENGLTGSIVIIGQQLRISPNKKTFRVVNSKAKKIAPKKVKLVKHKVRKGECLSVIARRYNTTISSIVSENKLASTIVKAGQRLKVPTNKKKYIVTKKRSKRSTSRMRLPVRGRLSSKYGYRTHPVYHKRLFHAGIDIAAPRNTPIAAARSGKVIYAGYRKGYGRLVILKHSNGYSTRYAHCNRLLVKKGQRIRAGQLIAKVGATGVATGNHLHFEVRKKGKTINPLKYVRMR